MPWFPIATGLWAVAMLAIFIQAIRLCYRVEARSPELRNTSGMPRNAMIFHVATNGMVAKDHETQAIRQRMNQLLLANLVGFALLGLGLIVTGAVGG